MSLAVYYRDEWTTVYMGEVRAGLAQLPDASVQCCITSPPYWGLRDYGVNGQIGLEPTPQEYVNTLTAVFREVRRVLKKDGTCWLNLGDTYARDPKKGDRAEYLGLHKNISDSGCHTASQVRTLGNLKPKDLVGIPWRVAFALQDDGWFLRQDIIWSKPNPMPESVTDRCTKSHEYVFLLSKSERYYWDQKAMQELSVTRDERKPYAPGQVDARGNGHDRNGGTIREPIREGKSDGKYRNRRSVWTIPTEPYTGAHFAVFPRALVEQCILVASRSGDTVLDCFSGSGTMLEVAKKHGRKGIGIDLNPDYCALAVDRIRGMTPNLFAMGQEAGLSASTQEELFA